MDSDSKRKTGRRNPPRLFAAGDFVCPVQGSLRKLGTQKPREHRVFQGGFSMVLQAVVSQQLVPTKKGTLTPAFELMTVTPDIRSMIRGKKIPQIDGRIYSAPGTSKDMFSMDSWLLNLYNQGTITRETALEHAMLPRLLGPKLS